ncbi:MAG: methylthioribulose 1-phosphate dehydratase [Deltaproteobacteria bacterium]|nr:MAG: methylthioribulose 1-phosphate dehydratase [Deltaproteobacteria bacterium]
MTARPALLSDDTLELRGLLAELGRRYHAAGWLMGTSGNLSARLPAPDGGPGDRALVTASGRHKGRLGTSDFVIVDLDGNLVAAGPDARPSAETRLHLAVYRRVPEAGVALHVHTVASTLLAPDMDGVDGAIGHARFADIEMIKGLDLWHPEDAAALPLFANHAHVPDIAADVERYYAVPREVPAFVIRGHGITAWGSDPFTADRHLEVTEFLCRVALARR